MTAFLELDGPGATRWSAWRGASVAAGMATLLLGCFPTVRLGSDAVGSSTTTVGGAPTSGSTDAIEATESSPAPTSGTNGASGDHSGTAGPADGGSSTGGSSGGGPSGTTTTGSTSETAADVCAVDEGDDPCLQCAREECCDELELCAEQQECSCFIECLRTTGAPMPCQSRCDPSSGIAAMSVCLAMTCVGSCA